MDNLLDWIENCSSREMSVMWDANTQAFSVTIKWRHRGEPKIKSRRVWPRDGFEMALTMMLDEIKRNQAM